MKDGGKKKVRPLSGLDKDREQALPVKQIERICSVSRRDPGSWLLLIFFNG